MTSTERFKIVMNILDENDLCNNTRNHVAFDNLSEQELSNSEKVSQIVEKIRDYEQYVETASNRYPENIMQKLRQRRGLEEYDTSEDQNINTMSPSEAFDDVCNWEGLINYSHTIKHWISDIYGTDLA